MVEHFYKLLPVHFYHQILKEYKYIYYLTIFIPQRSLQPEEDHEKDLWFKISLTTSSKFLEGANPWNQNGRYKTYISGSGSGSIPH